MSNYKVIGRKIVIDGMETVIKNQKELEDFIKFYKKELKETDFGTAKYKKLDSVLNTLNATKKELRYEDRQAQKEIIARGDIETKSYRQQSHYLSVLKSKYKDLAVEGKEGTTEAIKMLNEIGKVDSRLKEIDKSVGESFRNVGNYPDRLKGLEAELVALASAGKDQTAEAKKLNKEAEKHKLQLKATQTRYNDLVKSAGKQSLEAKRLKAELKNVQQELSKTEVKYNNLVKSGADQTAEAKSLRAEIKRIRLEMDKAPKSDSNSMLGGMLPKVGGLLGVAGALSLVTSKASELIKESVKLANESSGVDFAFNRIENASQKLSDTRVATKGMFSDLGIKKAIVEFDNFGLSIEQIDKLLKFVAVTSKQTGKERGYLLDSLVEGLSKQSKLRIDNLGISIGALNSELQKTPDFVEAVANIAEQKLSLAGDILESNKGSADRFNASLENLQIILGQEINKTGFFQSLRENTSNLMDAIALSTKGVGGEKTFKGLLNFADPLSGVRNFASSKIIEDAKKQILDIKDLTTEAGDAILLLESKLATANVKNSYEKASQFVFDELERRRLASIKAKEKEESAKSQKEIEASKKRQENFKKIQKERQREFEKTINEGIKDFERLDKVIEDNAQKELELVYKITGVTELENLNTELEQAYLRMNALTSSDSDQLAILDGIKLTKKELKELNKLIAEVEYLTGVSDIVPDSFKEAEAKVIAEPDRTKPSIKPYRDKSNDPAEVTLSEEDYKDIEQNGGDLGEASQYDERLALLSDFLEKKNEMYQNHASYVGETLGLIITGNEEQQEQALRNLGVYLIAEVEKYLQASLIKIFVGSMATADSIATFGAAGIAKAAAITALVKTAGSAAKSAIRGEDGLMIDYRTGKIHGKRHSDGGNRGVAYGQQIEIEKGERFDTDEFGNPYTINRRSSVHYGTKLDAIYGKKYPGKARDLSAINSKFGGISFFRDGGKMPSISQSIIREKSLSRTDLDYLANRISEGVAVGYSESMKAENDRIKRLENINNARI